MRHRKEKHFSLSCARVNMALSLSLICLTNFMQSSYKVKYLDLSHNEFGEVAGGILGPALGRYACSSIN